MNNNNDILESAIPPNSPRSSEASTLPLYGSVITGGLWTTGHNQDPDGPATMARSRSRSVDSQLIDDLLLTSEDEETQMTSQPGPSNAEKTKGVDEMSLEELEAYSKLLSKQTYEIANMTSSSSTTALQRSRSSESGVNEYVVADVDSTWEIKLPVSVNFWKLFHHAQTTESLPNGFEEIKTVMLPATVDLNRPGLVFYSTFNGKKYKFLDTDDHSEDERANLTFQIIKDNWYTTGRLACPLCYSGNKPKMFKSFSGAKEHLRAHKITRIKRGIRKIPTNNALGLRRRVEEAETLLKMAEVVSQVGLGPRSITKIWTKRKLMVERNIKISVLEGKRKRRSTRRK